MRRLLDFYEKLRAEKRGAVLATLVRVEGSHYRKPGARMLIAENGKRSGIISGGCLEDEVASKAKKVLANGKALLLRYDLRREQEGALGYGMGCEGLVTVLLEKVGAGKNEDPLAYIRDCFENEKAGRLGTVVEEGHPDLGKHFFGEKKTARGSGEMFWENVAPPLHLHVFGAGSDALPLLRFADELGWNVTLWDNRKLYLENCAKLLGKGVSVRAIQSQPEKIGEWFKGSPRTAAVVMTHHFGKDQKLLAELSKSALPYLGLLGPVKRGKALLDVLKKESGLTERRLKNLRTALHSPVGLDLASETPEEIALSIVSEIQSHFASANGKSLSRI